ncbi:alpha/beta-hydrolase [Myriangium duriaei CBS 260.36]|uniref:Alpha/beta-hydrolase n=1 Tax=Myriangium duriaei CBS 260.36 TaxID=1168546 RepID=A0A9P4J2G9_9PEZI|nr:alpha/beta-hydrolase [Myriangium duriaei CBS 260.36]
MDRFPNPEDLDATSIPHPFFEKMTEELREQAKTGNDPPPAFENHAGVKQGRAGRSALLDATYGESPSGVKETVREIPMRDGFQSNIRIYQPAKAVEGGSPVVMLSFGGGFAGENRAPGPYARGLVQLYGAVVINISYRLAPENPFPTSINDAWDSFNWIAKNASSLGGNPSKGFVLGGISAGGNISAVVTQNAVEQNFSPPITGVWLQVPIVFPGPDQVPDKYKAFFKSRDQNAVVPVLSLRSMQGVDRMLKPDLDSKWYSPFNAENPHKGIPPTYIQVNGMDPLRDDGVIYEKVLREHGTKTRLTVWPGLPHAHCSFFPKEEFSKSAVRDTIKGFGWLLDKPEAEDQAIDNAVAPAPSAGG